MTMISDTTVNQISLWRETIKVFQLYFKEWLPSAAVFFVIISAVYLGQSLTLPATSFLEQIQKSKTGLEVLHAFTIPALTGMVLIGLLSLVVILLQRYFYIVYFSGKIQLSKQGGHPTVNGLLFYLWKAIQVMAIMFAGIFVSVLLVTILLVAKESGGGGSLQIILGPLLAISIIAAIVLFVYLALRFCLAVTVSANGVKTALRTSTRLMHGNYLRVLGNATVLFFLIFIPGVMVSLVVRTVGLMVFHVAAPDANVLNPLIIINAVLTAALQVVVGGIYSAYSVVCVSILNREKKNQQTLKAA